MDSSTCIVCGVIYPRKCIEHISVCENCTPPDQSKIYYYNKYQGWIVEYNLLTCPECGEIEPRKCVSPIGDIGSVGNMFYRCSKCDPSNIEVSYYFSDISGWMIRGYKSECVTCGDVEYLSTKVNTRFCTNCNPCDDHNKYEYSGSYMSYIHTKCSIFSYKINRHSWKKVAFSFDNNSHYSCPKCNDVQKHKKEELDFKNTDGTITTTKSVVIAKNKEKKVNLVLACHIMRFLDKAIIKFTGLDVNTVACILGYHSVEHSYTKLPNANLRNANYSGLELSYTDFTGANLREAHFENCNLIGTTFTKADLRNCHMNKCFILDVSFAGANLKEADLSHCVITSSSFIGANVSKTNFHSSKLKNSNFTRAGLTGTDFTNTELSEINMASVKIKDTNFTESTWVNISAKNIIFEEANLSKVNMTTCNLSKCSFIECNLFECKITESCLNKSTFCKCVFDKCNLGVVGLANTILSLCTFVNSILDRIKVSDAKIISCDFTASFMYHINFASCKIHNCIFIKTTYQNVDNLFPTSDTSSIPSVPSIPPPQLTV